MPTIKGLHLKLSALKTSAEIAAMLESAGIKGTMGTGGSCPIAEYLKTGSDYASTGGELFVGSLCTHFRVIVDGRTSIRRLGHSNAMVRFVLDFDRSDYPNLIQES